MYVRWAVELPPREQFPATSRCHSAAPQVHLECDSRPGVFFSGSSVTKKPVASAGLAGSHGHPLSKTPHPVDLSGTPTEVKRRSLGDNSQYASALHYTTAHAAAEALGTGPRPHAIAKPAFPSHSTVSDAEPHSVRDRGHVLPHGRRSMEALQEKFHLPEYANPNTDFDLHSSATPSYRVVLTGGAC